jgi:hypothetical protein
LPRAGSQLAPVVLYPPFHRYPSDSGLHPTSDRLETGFNDALETLYTYLYGAMLAQDMHPTSQEIIQCTEPQARSRYRPILWVGRHSHSGHENGISIIWCAHVTGVEAHGEPNDLSTFLIC